MDKRPTIKDVAKASGVSWPTVSYVFNNSRAVSQKTRDRVLRTAGDLGYVPNAMARGLVTNRSSILGILVNRFHHSTSYPILEGIERAARAYEYRLALTLHHEDPAQAILDLQDLTARRMDGIIYVSSTDDVHPEITAALQLSQTPVVLAFTAAPEPGVMDSVLPDHVQGGLVATRRLLSKGRRRLAFIGAHAANNATRKRLEGFYLAHQELGLEPAAERIIFSEYSPKAGREAAQALLADPSPPDALFAAEDGIAAGVLQACYAARIRVPEDLAVIGFDNSVLCEATSPRLTSVEMPFAEIGRLCLERLAHRIESLEHWVPQSTLLGCRIAERDSG